VAAAGVQAVQVDTSNGASLEVQAGRSVLFANATWTCASPLGCELHARLCTPGEAFEGQKNATLFDRCRLQRQGLGPLRFQVAAPEPGNWLLVLWSDGPDAEVRGVVEMAAL
jgi:hypothetical protein